MAARGVNFGDAGSFQAGGSHAQGGAQAGTPSPYNNNIMIMIGNGIG
jgi:hypothetical protein